MNKIEKLDAHDPRYKQAIDSFKAEFGISIPDMLLPTMWCAAMVNGEPQIMLNAEGMRAMALTAPRPNAPALVEEWITKARGSGYYL